MLLALRANELGFLLGPTSGPRVFTGLAFFLGFGEWTFTPIFKPYHFLYGYFSLVTYKFLNIFYIFNYFLRTFHHDHILKGFKSILENNLFL